MRCTRGCTARSEVEDEPRYKFECALSQSLPRLNHSGVWINLEIVLVTRRSGETAFAWSLRDELFRRAKRQGAEW